MPWRRVWSTWSSWCRACRTRSIGKPRGRKSGYPTWRTACSRARWPRRSATTHAPGVWSPPRYSSSIPGVAGDQRNTERAYRELCHGIEQDLGSAPRSQRIFRLWSRPGAGAASSHRGGRPDTLRGGTVIAIFAMGPDQPFVVCRQQEPGSQAGMREILGSRASSVQEFDASAADGG